MAKTKAKRRIKKRRKMIMCMSSMKHAYNDLASNISDDIYRTIWQCLAPVRYSVKQILTFNKLDDEMYERKLARKRNKKREKDKK